MDFEKENAEQKKCGEQEVRKRAEKRFYRLNSTIKMNKETQSREVGREEEQGANSTKLGRHNELSYKLT